MRLFILASVLLSACGTLPDPHTRQNAVGRGLTLSEDSLRVDLYNPVPSPIRYRITAQVLNLDTLFLAQPLDTLRVAFPTGGKDTSKVRSDLRVHYYFGDPARPVRPRPMAPPFPRDRWYRVIQAYGGSFSHQTPYSRYTLDFAMAEGDTVSAADDGVVVGVIEANTVGGDSREYRPYANYVTLFHPETGLYSQYVHLQPEGSLVAVGDTVSRYQPIGLSGNTGFSSRAHLHFNVMVPDSAEGMVSYPIWLEGEIDARTIRRNDRVEHGRVTRSD